MDLNLLNNNEIFPSNILIEEVREIVKSRKEFKEISHDHYVVFDYLIQTADTFPNPELEENPKKKREYQIRRECRGLIFSKEHGQLLSRRFHKFFNVNEGIESNESKIDFTQPYIVLEKEDGSMIAPFIINGNIIFATKKGNSVSAKNAENFAIDQKKNNKIDYFSFCEKYLKEGWTVLFEWCSRKDPVLIDYPEDQLYLTAMRNNQSGVYLDHEKLKLLAKENNIPIAKEWIVEGKAKTSFEVFLQEARKKTGKEGFVVRFSSGKMLKVKTNFYYSLARGLSVETNSNSEKYLWITILENSYDDVKSFIAFDERQSLDKFAFDLIQKLIQKSEQMSEELKQWRISFDSIKNSFQYDPLKKSEFGKWVKGNNYESLYWRLWNGENPQEALIDYCLKAAKAKKGFENVLPLADNIKFKDYCSEEQQENGRKKFSDWH